MVKKAVQIPLLAAGGIASGAAMLAVMNLGADGVQIGSRFAASIESSAHQNFKEAVIAAEEGSTLLTLKELTPVRLLKNPFFEQVQAAYAAGNSIEELKNLLGRGRAKKGMFEGDLIEGELEIGQIAGSFEKILSAQEIVQEIVGQYNLTLTQQQAL
jgi:enoyl-[acyl-carrier protein] reductase II